MPNRFKIALALVSAVVLAIIIWFVIQTDSSSAPLTNPLANQDKTDAPAPQQKQQKLKQPTQTASITTPQQSTSTNQIEIKNSSTCISRTQYDQDPRHQIIEHYIKNEYLGRQVDHFNYLDEEQLNQQAKEGSVRAMFVLGLNYRWNARMQNFRAESIRPPEQPKPNYYAKKQLDDRMMNKARYWLLEAAARGQLVALAEIAVSYEYQAYRAEIDNPEDIDTIIRLKLYAQSYRQLHHKQAPELSSLDDEDPIEPQYLSQLENISANIERSWQKRREQLGLPAKIELNLPIEFKQLEQLANNLCKE